MADTVYVAMWNVNGLLDKLKRGVVLRHAKRLGVDVLLLQETHLMGNKAPFLARFGFSQVFHAGFTRGSRGVAILVRSHVPLKVDSVSADRLRRYLMITGELERGPCSFCCIYSLPPPPCY